MIAAIPQEVIMALPSSSMPIKSPIAAASSGATLESRVSALERVIQVSTDGSILIKGATSIKIEAGSLKVRVGASLDLESSANIGFKAGGTLNLNSGGYTNLRGAIISVNGGTLPVARVGSGVVNGRISEGSSHLMA